MGVEVFILDELKFLRLPLQITKISIRLLQKFLLIPVCYDVWINFCTSPLG